MFNIDADFDRAERLLTDLGRKQIPFAASQALNDTALEVKVAEEREIERSLDRPTPFTKRGLYVRRSSKNRLLARVGVKDIQAEYLSLQVKGGVRRPKGRALIVPVGARLNKYGNLPKGSLARTKAKANVFVASKGRRSTAHLAPGIYERPKRGKYRSGGSGSKNVGSQKGPKLLIAFEPRASYRKRLRFYPVAEGEARRKFEGNFIARLKVALQTAR